MGLPEVLKRNRTAFLLAFFFLFYAFSLNGFLGANGDDANYAILAKALAEGKGYTDLQSPGQPFHAHFPPVFPLLISPLVFFFGLNFFAVKFLVSFIAVLVLCLVFIFFKRHCSENLAIALTALLGFSPLFFSYSHQVMAEIPFMFFAFLSLFFFAKFTETNSRNFFAFSLLFVLLAFFTKLTGITFVAALLFVSFRKGMLKDRKNLFLASLAVLAVVFWFFVGTLAPGNPTQHYLELAAVSDPRDTDLGSVGVEGFFSRAIHHALFYVSNTASNLFPGYNSFFPHSSILRHFLSPLIFALVLTGFLSSLHRKAELKEVYFLFYFALLIFFTSFEERYLLPLLPFLFYYFFTGTGFLLGKLNFSLGLKKNIPRFFFLLILFLGVIASAGIFLQERNPNYVEEVQGQGWHNYLKAAEWAKQNTPEDAVIVARKQNNFYIYSGRKAFHFFFGSDEERILSEFEEKGAGFVVVDEFNLETKKFLEPVVRNNPERFSLVKEFGETRIYEFT